MHVYELMFDQRPRDFEDFTNGQVIRCRWTAIEERRFDQESLKLLLEIVKLLINVCNGNKAAISGAIRTVSVRNQVSVLSTESRKKFNFLFI